jgi:hypothetical protein
VEWRTHTRTSNTAHEPHAVPVAGREDDFTASVIQALASVADSFDSMAALAALETAAITCSSTPGAARCWWRFTNDSNNDWPGEITSESRSGSCTAFMATGDGWLVSVGVLLPTIRLVDDAAPACLPTMRRDTVAAAAVANEDEDEEEEVGRCDVVAPARALDRRDALPSTDRPPLPNRGGREALAVPTGNGNGADGTTGFVVAPPVNDGFHGGKPAGVANEENGGEAAGKRRRPALETLDGVTDRRTSPEPPVELDGVRDGVVGAWYCTVSSDSKPSEEPAPLSVVAPLPPAGAAVPTPFSTPRIHGAAPPLPLLPTPPPAPSAIDDDERGMPDDDVGMKRRGGSGVKPVASMPALADKLPREAASAPRAPPDRFACVAPAERARRGCAPPELDRCCKPPLGCTLLMRPRGWACAAPAADKQASDGKPASNGNRRQPCF